MYNPEFETVNVLWPARKNLQLTRLRFYLPLSVKRVLATKKPVIQ